MPIWEKAVFFCCDVVGYISTLIATHNYIALAAWLAVCGLIGTAIGKLLPKKNTNI